MRESDIEELALDILFDAVVLGSFLIHAPAPGARAALLQVCRRHVKPAGVVLVQHYRDGWPASAVPGFMAEKDGIKVFVDDVVHDQLQRTRLDGRRPVHADAPQIFLENLEAGQRD